MWDHSNVAADAGGREGSREVLVEYRSVDYRGFLFVVHDVHGLMLLRCTRKKSKGPHWQVPGGHVDEPEFLAAGTLFEPEGSFWTLVVLQSLHLPLYLFLSKRS
jgi:8-oxo-dGTP pyrophosphatase MutT (NUDIX family)